MKVPVARWKTRLRFIFLLKVKSKLSRDFWESRNCAAFCWFRGLAVSSSTGPKRVRDTAQVVPWKDPPPGVPPPVPVHRDQRGDTKALILLRGTAHCARAMESDLRIPPRSPSFESSRSLFWVIVSLPYLGLTRLSLRRDYK